MTDAIKYAMAMSCVLPAATGIYKYKKIDQKFHPFIGMMILDVIVETIFYLAGKFQVPKITPLTVNLYMLINFGLFLYFVNINKYVNRKLMQVLLAGAILTGIFNYLYYGTLFTFFYYLLCFVSTVMLMVSIDILSRQIMAIKDTLFNNPWFWISSFSILYNAFTLLIFGLYFFALSETPNGKAIGVIQHFVNATCYIFFAVAILRMPEKNT